jgi:hypothetical protein
VKCRHMPVFHLQHGKARTIRAEGQAWRLGNRSDSHAAHMTRVWCIERESSTYLVLRNKKSSLLVVKKRWHEFTIGERTRTKWTDMNCTPGTTPGCSPFQERTKRRRQPSIKGTAGTATNLAALTTGVYSSSGVPRGPEPPTSST